MHGTGPKECDKEMALSCALPCRAIFEPYSFFDFNQMHNASIAYKCYNSHTIGFHYYENPLIDDFCLNK